MPRRSLSVIIEMTVLFVFISVTPLSADSPERVPTIEAPPASKAEDKTDRTITELKSSIPGLMNKARIPGLQIALIREGAVVWEGAYGVAKSDGGQAVTNDTIFEAASLTKPLFAYAVMKMVDEKLIDLDTPLLGSFPPEQVEEFLGHPIDTKGFRLDWAMDYIKALEDPAKFEEGELQKMAGDYGPRHLILKDGSLHYFREDADTSKARPLLAVSEDTFVIEGVSYFKLQIVFDEDSNPTKLVGIYESGQRDESLRDP